MKKQWFIWDARKKFESEDDFIIGKIKEIKQYAKGFNVVGITFLDMRFSNGVNNNKLVYFKQDDKCLKIVDEDQVLPYLI